MINLPDPTGSVWRKQKGMEWPPDSKNIAASVWQHALTRTTVLRSIAKMRDGSEWIHVSVAHKTMLPDWNDLVRIRDEFIGKDCECYQVFPKVADYINIHSNCLHIWCPVDEIRRVANLQDIEYEKSI